MYRFTTAILVTYAMVGLAPPNATGQIRALDLRSEILTPPVLIENVAPAAHEIRLRGKIDQNGEGHGVLTLDPNAPTFDAFGTGMILNHDKQQVSLDVKIQFVREGRTQIEAGPPPEQWFLYRITSDKMKTSVALAAPNKKLLSGRILVHDQNEKVMVVVTLSNPFPPGSPPLPCHPGCFPAGTLVSTPNGVERIEVLEPGSRVITLDEQGQKSVREVRKVFVVENEVLKLETEHGQLLTTETQPICLSNRTTTGAGQLSKNDAILRWDNDKMVETKILSIQERFRATRVYNLVFDETTFFVANSFVVRSKPPALNESESVAR